MKNPHLTVSDSRQKYWKRDSCLITKDNPDIRLDSIQKVKNPNYLFLNFTIGPNAKPGNLKLISLWTIRYVFSYHSKTQMAMVKPMPVVSILPTSFIF